MEGRRGLAALVLASFVAVSGAAAHEGDIDLGFGVGGQIVDSVGASNDQFKDVLVDPKGRIVAVGTVEVGGFNQLALIRYRPSGVRDASFGSGGLVQEAIGSTNTFPLAVARDAQGRLLVAGAADSHLFVARFRPDGTADTFGTSGVARQSIGYKDEADAVAVDGKGRIVVAGIIQSASGQPYDVLVLRFTPAGALDPTFGGGDGIVTRHLGWSLRSSFGKDVAIDRKGRIVVAVNATQTSEVYVMGAMRLLGNGDLDSTFGNNGRVLATVDVANTTAASGLALDGRGRIVLGGWSNRKFAVVRLTPSGQLDRSFSSDGKVTTAATSADSYGYGLALDPQGRIVLAGLATVNAGYHDVAVVRYLPSGKPDPSFGSRGVVVTFVGRDEATQNAVATDARSRIIVAGGAKSGTNPNDSLLVRYLGDQTRPRVTISGPSRVALRARTRVIRFRLSANEPVQFRCRVDARASKRCGAHYSTPALRAGRHVLRVVATDPAGNRGTKTKTFRIVS